MVVLPQKRPKDCPAWMQGEWSGKEGPGLQWGGRKMSSVNVTEEFSTEHIQFSIAMIINQTVTVTM